MSELKALLHDYVRVRGPDHPETLKMRHELFWWLGFAGKVDEALSQLEELLKRQRSVLGPHQILHALTHSKYAFCRMMVRPQLVD